MKRPRWVSALAVTFTSVGLLLTGGAWSLSQRVEVDHGDWFPGFALGVDRQIAMLLLLMGTWLILTGLGIWRKPRVSMRIAGSMVIGASLLPFVLRFMSISVDGLLWSVVGAGLALLTLGSLGVIIRLILFCLGIALFFYSRDVGLEVTGTEID